MNNPENWSKEFDERFVDESGVNDRSPDDVKDFISSLFGNPEAEDSGGSN
jgi:hypothetical protein